MNRLVTRWLPPPRIPTRTNASTFAPEAGAQCVSSARWDLRRGPARKGGPYRDRRFKSGCPDQLRGHATRAHACADTGLTAMPRPDRRAAPDPACRLHRGQRSTHAAPSEAHLRRRQVSAKVMRRLGDNHGSPPRHPDDGWPGYGSAVPTSKWGRRRSACSFGHGQVPITQYGERGSKDGPGLRRTREAGAEPCFSRSAMS